MVSSNPSTSPRVEAVQEFISVFKTLDAAPLEKLLSPSYNHTMGPASVDPFKIGPFDKAGFIGHVAGLSYLMTSFPVTITEIVDSESSNSVWAWTASDVKWRSEVTDGDAAEWSYQGQNLFMFWFDAEGKIERVIEVLDSQKSINELLPLLGRAGANLQKAAAA
ncbi:unnamed protein product [Periconia digitata]|uniref:Uncharacterized protein n=1 Tax=Periconia digitata TaxID=1303443 RepID=A0A9W4U4I7_9PLEO|nr:unnamed protein product [Periconia digitata]